MEQLHLPENLGQKLSFIAKEIGISSDACVQEAVLRFVEDYEDARGAEHILNQPAPKTYTTEEVRAHIERKKS